MSRSIDAPISPAVVEQACHWLMLHWDNGLDQQQTQAFTAWQAADPEHQRAWQRLQRVEATLQTAPKQTLHQVLGKRPERSRREVLKLLSLTLLVGGGGYVAMGQLPLSKHLAGERTSVGEVRRIQLTDGSMLELNSDTAVSIQFDRQTRRVRLLSGEIMLSSAENSSLDPRPLVVEVAAGEVQALGTRFAVREQAGVSHVELYEGALEVRPWHAPAILLQAGQALQFSARTTGNVSTANPDRIAWREGRLVSSHLPLGQFLAELSRHRPGVIRCEPAVAELPITGVFPLADTDRVLATLKEILPIDIHYLTRYWVTVKAS